MSRTYQLTPHETVVVRREGSDELAVEVTYGQGQAPLAHFHPAQDESFEVISGVVGARIGGVAREYRAGDRIVVPRGAVHQMWNAGEGDAKAAWVTTPAGRTLEWFRALDELQRSGSVGKGGMPGPLAMGVLLTEYRDVMRLAARPRSLVRGVLALLGWIGRLRGYAVATRTDAARAATQRPAA
jgi:quercetin dioxygenase-like cupin family protein